MTERIPSIDVRFFVTALLIQKETGGNLAEILDELSRVIRDRFRIYREVRVRTAQGRLTAGILIALPIFMMIVLHDHEPDLHARPVRRPQGRSRSDRRRDHAGHRLDGDLEDYSYRGLTHLGLAVSSFRVLSFEEF